MTTQTTINLDSINNIKSNVPYLIEIIYSDKNYIEIECNEDFKKILDIKVSNQTLEFKGVENIFYAQEGQNIYINRVFKNINQYIGGQNISINNTIITGIIGNNKPSRVFKNINQYIEGQNISINNAIITRIIGTNNSNSIVIGSIGRNEDALSVKVYLNKLQNISLQGSGDILLQDMNISESLSVTLNGSGDITLINNTISFLNAKVVGSGDIDFTKSLVKDACLNIVGSGDIEGSVYNHLDARVVGSGDITITNRPKTIKKSVVGSGDITMS